MLQEDIHYRRSVKMYILKRYGMVALLLAIIITFILIILFRDSIEFYFYKSRFKANDGMGKLIYAMKLIDSDRGEKYLLSIINNGSKEEKSVALSAIYTKIWATSLIITTVDRYSIENADEELRKNAARANFTLSSDFKFMIALKVSRIREEESPKKIKELASSLNIQTMGWCPFEVSDTPNEMKLKVAKWWEENSHVFKKDLEEI